jgi:hypothetical protein
MKRVGLRTTSTAERIDDGHAGVDEIATVSRGDSQTADGRRRRDEAILDRQIVPGCRRTSRPFRSFQTVSASRDFNR